MGRNASKGKAINVGGFTSMATLNAILVQWPDNVRFLHELPFTVSSASRGKLLDLGVLEFDAGKFEGDRTIDRGGCFLSEMGKRTRARRRAELDAVMAKKP